MNSLNNPNLAINSSVLAKGIVGLTALLAIIVVLFGCVTWLDAKHLMNVQFPNGTLKTYTEPGPTFTWFGTTTKYERRSQFSFDNDAKVCKGASKNGDSGPQTIRFSEGGHAQLCGALSWEMPLKPELLLQIQKDFGSQDAVEQQLVAKALTNAIYFSGQMMTSTESSAERRAELLSLIEDQLKNGVYKTSTRQERQMDPITKTERTVSIVEVLKNKDGTPQRSAVSAIAEYGIQLVQTTISEIKYEQAVEKQIQEQQQSKTQVQIAMANARRAEQEKLTTEAQGASNAAAAKWKQETIKAQAVTEAEQQKEVAKLQKEAAEFTKQREILLGQGESERKRLVMNADGALTQKLDAYKEVNKMYAHAIENYKGAWVPSTYMGGGAAGGSPNMATTFMELLTIKTAKDLNLDLKK